MASRNKPITSHSIFPLTLLFDGDCEVCALEMDDLKARDRERRLVFVDIAQPQFDPARYGARITELRAQIHAVRPDGRMLKGVSVLHVAYAAVGRGWMFAPVQWPLVKPMLDAVYRVLSRHRGLITRTVSPWLFGVWDRRARGTLQRMHDTCIQTDSPAIAERVNTTAARGRPLRASPRADNVDGISAPPVPHPPVQRPAGHRRAPAGELSSLWQDTLPAINPPSRRS
ncbi:MAG: DUF393 domain-containing protein [Pseudomonadota bacterium]